MCVDMCADMRADMRVSMNADMWVDLCADMRADMYVDMCVDMCAGMCASTCADKTHVCPQAVAQHRRVVDVDASPLRTLVAPRHAVIAAVLAACDTWLGVLDDKVHMSIRMSTHMSTRCKCPT